MRILVLGGSGMLGHQLVESWQARHEVHATFRGTVLDYASTASHRDAISHYNLDARRTEDVRGLIQTVRPQVVVNAVGIVKQRDLAKDAVASIEINSLFPHHIAQLSSEVDAYFVHLSTDCVFSGRAGMYVEDDLPDPVDLYGRSKLLGEVASPNSITLRTSIIGLELANRSSLVEWFLAQRGTIKGFEKAIYSGLTTMEMARVIERVVLDRAGRHGVYHVSSEPIDKLTLLTKLRTLLGRNVELVPDSTLVCDRSLDSSRFRSDFAYAPPTWDAMLEELAGQIRERHG